MSWDPRDAFANQSLGFQTNSDQILATIKQMRDLMQQENVSAQEIAAATQLLQAAKGGGSSDGSGSLVPAFTVPLPMSPQVLTEMIYAASVPSLAQKGVLSETVLVPAGQAVTLTIPVISGTVTLFTSGLKVTANYYDPSIVADVVLDGQNISPAPYEYAVVGEDTVSSIQYTYVTQYLSGVFTNYTTTDTMITFKAEVLAVDQTLFEQQLWLPLMRRSLDVAKELASLYATGG